MAIERIPSDISRLSEEVVQRLRSGHKEGFSSLTDQQQHPYNELGLLCLDYLIRHPRPESLRKLGPNEEAYGIDIMRSNGASLRVNYYAAEGSCNIRPGTVDAASLDTTALGTPHNHIGHIAAVVPAGKLIHHTFMETSGRDYAAGNIRFEKQGSGPSTSFFVPERTVGLRSADAGAFDASNGYWMNRDVVHIVTWPEPTITVWFNDAIDGRRPSTTYNHCGAGEELGRNRGLGPVQQERVWSAFSQLIHNTLEAS